LDMRLTCRFEADNAINLPRRSTGSAQLSVVGQATGKRPERSAMRGSSHGSILHLADTDRASDLLRVCHRRRLRSAISVNPPLGLWGSSASRLGGWANKAGQAALNELSAPVLTIHDVPHRGITCRFGRSTVLPEHRSADQHRIIAIATPPPRRGPNGAEVAGRVVPPWGTAICSQHPCS
jgi:hypothetical protein